jgi:hypothetical protein
MRLQRLQTPILLSLFFSSAYIFPQEITRIQIKSIYLGLADAGEEELNIEKKDSHFYAQKEMVSDAAVCALLETINSRIIEKPDLENLGVTQTWLNENARPALSEYLKNQRKALSSKQKKHFLTSFTNLQSMKKVVDDYYSRYWTDDDPRIEIVVQTEEDKVIEITSSSQQEFMLPWHVSSVGPGAYFTWDATFSRVIAQLLPKDFLNKDRIAGLCFRQALSDTVMESSSTCVRPRVWEKRLGPPAIGAAPTAK